MLKKFEKYGYTGLRSFLFITLLASLFLIILGGYFLYKENQPVNYFMTENSENYLIMPSTTPILQVGRAREWATGAIAKLFTFNFVNVDKHMDEIRAYFSDQGWSNLNTQLTQNQLLKDVVSKSLVFEASLCDLPVLSGRLQDPKAFYLSSKWKFIIPIIINVVGASGVERNLVYIIKVDVRFLTDQEVSAEKKALGATSVLGIDAINMESAGMTNYCKI